MHLDHPLIDKVEKTAQQVHKNDVKDSIKKPSKQF